MRYVKPEYYDDFRCLADKCPDTCCAGWQILIDDASLEKYQRMESPMGRRLAGSIDWQDGSLLQFGGRCSLLNEENLCDLVLEEGEDALCETCSRYPRHVEEFDGLRELSLSLSCPRAAEMILLRQKPVAFYTEEDGEPDPLEEEFQDFDFLLFTMLEDARTALFKILQNRSIPMAERMKGILELADRLQDCAEEERFCEMEDVIGEYMEKWEEGCRKTRELSGKGKAAEEIRYEKLRENFQIFYRLEHLRDEWPEILKAVQDTLYAGNYEDYSRIREAFLAEFGPGGLQSPWWEAFRENLLLFFLYTYFCGAVYDGWIYSKAALGVFSACYVEELIMNCWFLADKRINREKCVELAYRYAREVEHSDDNLNLLEEWLQQNRYREGY